MSNQINAIGAFLSKSKISYQFKEYDEKVKNAAEAGIQIGLPEKQMLKSLLVKKEKGFRMFLIPLPTRIDFNRLEKTLKTKLRMATREEIKEKTGYDIGYVCPFLLKTKIPVYIDSQVLKLEKIGIASGKKGIEVVLDPADLKKVTEAKMIDLI